MSTRHGSATVTLPSDTTFLITRQFDAPRQLVWEAITTPRHLLRWWGPDWCPLVSCSIDLRPGGSWRYVSRNVDGLEFAWHGVYREIVPAQRIVQTEIFEAFPDGEALNTMTLVEHDGVTTLQTLVQHENQANRDGHVNSGMESGMQITFNRLDDVLLDANSSAGRYRRIAAQFDARVQAMTSDSWDNPAPCDGWVARDIVTHLVTWVPSVISQAGIEFAPTDPLNDPVGAWTALDATLQTALDDPDVAARTFHVGPPGEMTVEAAIGMLVLGDVLIHTWDLARAGGLDETLPADIVSEMLIGMEPLDDMLRTSGHYGPRVIVPDISDDQTKLIAFTGRTP